jgi:hypothetical protein
MLVTIRIPRPAGCPCCAAEEAMDAMRIKSFIERAKNVLGEEAEIEIVFDSSKDTPNVSIDGKVLCKDRYPDSEELREYFNSFLRRKEHKKVT